MLTLVLPSILCNDVWAQNISFISTLYHFSGKVKVKVDCPCAQLIKYCAMKAYGKVDV
jgi:hypothetical protein